MNIEAMKSLSVEISAVMPWITGITEHQQYKELVAIMDDLVEDYDANQVLIELLLPVLHRYEEESDHFKAFNEKIDAINSGVAVLRVLIDQYNLTLSDLPEIGDKSLVSQFLSGKRALTINHIKALSKRFGVPTHLFI